MAKRKRITDRKVPAETLLNTDSEEEETARLGRWVKFSFLFGLQMNAMDD